MKSLRSRLLIGSLLWTLGLVWVSNVLILGLLRHQVAGPLVHWGGMSVVAVGLLVAGLVQLRSVLAPFALLRRQLGAVRAGERPRIEGAFPSEISPAIAELNQLLEHRARLAQRAIARAGDLAHGLKTPLALLQQEAEQLAAAGEHELAGRLARQVEQMRRQIDYHLAHARAAASGAALGASSSLAGSAAGLERTLRRLYAEKAVAIEIAVPPSVLVRVQAEDLDEMLGNLLDNACKWARSRVALRAELRGTNLEIVIDDDGPGIPAELREQVLQRGVRADEAAPGSGLGLAIVSDLAALYGGSIALEDAPSGGLRARLTLPTSTTSPDA